MLAHLCKLFLAKLQIRVIFGDHEGESILLQLGIVLSQFCSCSLPIQVRFVPFTGFSLGKQATDWAGFKHERDPAGSYLTAAVGLAHAPVVLEVKRTLIAGRAREILKHGVIGWFILGGKRSPCFATAAKTRASTWTCLSPCRR